VSPAMARGVAAAAIAIGVACSAASAQEQTRILRTEDALVALFTLQTEVEVERRLMQREEARYEGNLRSRAALRDRLDTLYEELEVLFLRERALGNGDEAEEEEDGAEVDPEELLREAQEKEDEIRAMEGILTAARDEGRRIREEIRRLQERIRALIEKQGTLRVGMPEDSSSVTGVWDVRLLPSGDRGVFALWQSGTLVSGQYILDGPYRGSLEGTLINRQLLIKRIDSSLGRVMELSAYLSDDGRSVQGTWLNYDLSSGKAPTGSWAATKRSSSPSESGDGGEAP